MADYITVDEVLNYLRVPQEYRNSLDLTYVQELIKMRMDYVDYITNTTWNGRIKQTKERHDLHYYKGGIVLGPGIPIVLGHAPIRKVLKITVFQGRGWHEVDMNDYGRATGSYWVDRQSGILYLQRFLIRWGGAEVRVVYTYGRTDLDPRVRELTLLLVAKDLLMNEAWWFGIPEANNSVSLDVEDRLRWIDARIDQLTSQLMTGRIPVNTEYNVEVATEDGDLSLEPPIEYD